MSAVLAFLALVAVSVLAGLAYVHHEVIGPIIGYGGCVVLLVGGFRWAWVVFTEHHDVEPPGDVEVWS